MTTTMVEEVNGSWSPLKGSTVSLSSRMSGLRRMSLKPNEFTPQRSIESYGLLDLYSYNAFRTVLHTPRIYDAFAAFLRSELSSEHLVFWSRCERMRQLKQELSDSVSTIHQDHLRDASNQEINISHRSRVDGVEKVDSMKLALDQSQNAFDSLQKEVELLMWRDSYPRFLKHRLAYNASKSLEWSSGRPSSFKGLGECFCITDPRKPDNPILMCSDAFVKVTGFTFSDIVNNNCRFLQGDLSDHATVGRIRAAIREGRESTEVILNYRKDGTPFWNLLLVAPVKDESGRIQNFFGAQVDVSSLFGKHNDLSAILAKDFAVTDGPQPGLDVPRKSFLRRLSDRAKMRQHHSPFSFTPLSSSTPALEEEVLRDNITTIGEQVEVFRSAYGKYLIVYPDTGIIKFASDSAKALFPAGESLSSQSIFPLLTQTFSDMDSRSLKSLQRAFNHGQATAIRMTASPPTTPSTESLMFNLDLGNDRVPRSRQSSTGSYSSWGSGGLTRGHSRDRHQIVAVHLTPLKNVKGKVELFVFVLATGV